MIERADEPAVKTEERNTQDKKEDSRTEDARSQTREADNLETDLEKILEELFDGMRPTKRFGQQKASEKIKESYNEIRDSSKPVEFEGVSRAIERGKFNRRKWDDTRSNSEIKLNELKTEYEADIAEIAGEIGKDLARVEKWSKKSVEDYEELGSTYEFEDQEDLTAIEFIELVSQDMESIDFDYTNIQEDLARLGQEVEEKRVSSAETDKTNVRGLGTDSKQILQYENKALSYRFDEDLYSRIQDKNKQKKRLRNTFLSRRNDVEEAYNEHADNLEIYITEKLNALDQTTDLLERISSMKPERLEDILEENYSRNISERIIQDGEEQLRRQYRRTVGSLEDKAEKQYKQLEKPVSKLERLEKSLPNDYFSDMERSEELKDVLNSQETSSLNRSSKRTV